MTNNDIQEILVALQKLGYTIAETDMHLYTIDFIRFEVFIRSHEYIGIYDLAKHTFID